MKVVAGAEPAPSHDEGPGPDVRFADELVVRLRLAAFEAVQVAPALQADDPFVKLFATLAEGLLQRRILSGDETVDGHRDVEKCLHTVQTVRRAKDHRRIAVRSRTHPVRGQG